MHRRDKVLLGFSLSAFVGTGLLVGVAAWFLWSEAIETEEEAIAEFAETLGQRTERIIADTSNTLQELNQTSEEPCSSSHLDNMARIAFAEPHILAIGFWRATERLCGAGFTQAIQLKPPKADRIYDSGYIAWWPGPQTEVDGIQLFLMRYQNYDIAMDPRVLLQATPIQDRQVGLWVEGLRMAAVPWDADLPAPDSLPAGLRADHGDGRMLARFSLGTIFPIDIVVAEPIGQFWDRYLPTIMVTAAVVLVLAALWIYSVLYFMRRRLSLAMELRESLASGGIKARYQPIMDLSTGQCVGAEALVRWKRDNGENMAPDAFMTIAEDASLVPMITLAMVDAILKDLTDLLRRQPDIRINLNLAPEDIENPDFARALDRRIYEAQVSPRCFKLEITERALINSEEGRRVISQFRQQGHEIAIDDFGTGYSSLSYLQNFDLDILKIDKSFVDAIGTEAVTSQVIHHVIELAKGLDLDIVAEGVETEEQAGWLRMQGVAYAQGYLYSKPLPAADFRDFLRTHQVSNVYSLSGAVISGSHDS